MDGSRDALLARLQIALPSMTEAFGGTDIEAQSRAVLGYVVGPIVAVETSVLAWQPSDFDASTCPNCGMPVGSIRTPYCSESCREMAGFVRKFRAGLELGWIFEPEKQVALGQVLWHLLGGGRPLRQHIAPVRARAKAFQRAEGKCEACGKAATNVDHIGSGCNRPINLRAVCDSCCLDRRFGDPRIVNSRVFQEVVPDLAARVCSSSPLRCCDDPDSWDWREYQRERASNTLHE